MIDTITSSSFSPASPTNRPAFSSFFRPAGDFCTGSCDPVDTGYSRPPPSPVHQIDSSAPSCSTSPSKSAHLLEPDTPLPSHHNPFSLQFHGYDYNPCILASRAIWSSPKINIVVIRGKSIRKCNGPLSQDIIPFS